MAEVLETVVSWILAGMILALVLLLLAIPVLWALNIILTPLAPFIERWAERMERPVERWTERMERGTERSTERWAERTKRTEEWFDRVEEWFERAKAWLDRAEKSRARRRDSNSDG